MKNQTNETFLTACNSLYLYFITYEIDTYGNANDNTYGLLSELKLLHERICLFRKCLSSTIRVSFGIMKNLE